MLLVYVFRHNKNMHISLPCTVRWHGRTSKQIKWAKNWAQTGGEWDQFLPQVELRYNSSVHSSMGFSPFFLVHGREPNLPRDVVLNCSPVVTSLTPGTPAAYVTFDTFKDEARNSLTSKLQRNSQYGKKLWFLVNQEILFSWMTLHRK